MASDFEVGPEYFHIAVGLGVLALVTGALRFWSRWISKASFGQDDYWMLAAEILMVALVIDSGYMFISGGNGRSFDVITQREEVTFKKAFYASQILYFTTMTLVKISILFLYHTIFGFPSRVFRISTLLVGLFCMAWCIGGTLATAFQCNPASAFWNGDNNSKCLSGTTLFDAVLSLNILTDVVILALPLRMIWQLHLPMRQRLTILTIFSIGIGAPIVCLLRILAFVNIGPKTDYSLLLIQCGLWTIIEPQLAIVCANCSTFRPLLPYSTAIISKLNLQFTSQSDHQRKSWYGSTKVGSTDSKDQNDWKDSSNLQKKMIAVDSGTGGGTDELTPTNRYYHDHRRNYLELRDHSQGPSPMRHNSKSGRGGDTGNGTKGMDDFEMTRTSTDEGNTLISSNGMIVNRNSVSAKHTTPEYPSRPPRSESRQGLRSKRSDSRIRTGAGSRSDSRSRWRNDPVERPGSVEDMAIHVKNEIIVEQV
ncbi:hypothetical protein MMC25_004408 [Agyrium rufum]|nr:hypothetical protein [Agyrium rufum]